MICPRCGSENIEVIAKSPKDNVWEVFMCNCCFYSYRSTEPENRKSRSLYDERFKVDLEQVNSIGVIPPVPPLKENL